MKQLLNRVLTVVDVEDAVAPEQSGATIPQEVPERNSDETWGFIKNLNTGELITFEDGEEFRFPKNFFITGDRELAEKLRSVAGKYNIIENS